MVETVPVTGIGCCSLSCYPAAGNQTLTSIDCGVWGKMPFHVTDQGPTDEERAKKAECAGG